MQAQNINWKPFLHRIKIESNAKINLYASISEPMIDGLWEFNSLIIPIDLCDTVDIQLQEERSIKISCTSSQVPEGVTNVCYQAAKLMMEIAPWYRGGVKIKITKNIPVSSGLGGGSSNATAVLKALNIMLGINLHISDLSDLALKISKDSYFFCFNTPVYLYKSSDNIIPLPHSNQTLQFVIIDPEIPFIPNKSVVVFKRITNPKPAKDSIEKILYAWNKKDIQLLQKNCYNFLTPEIMPEYKPAYVIRDKIFEELGFAPTFTGTGPFLVMPIAKNQLDLVNSVCRKLELRSYNANAINL